MAEGASRRVCCPAVVDLLTFSADAVLTERCTGDPWLWRLEMPA
ncbi:MAG TPA: hypothetical protein VFV38_16260 [Ktedonobacteraceae bacterium]|nr:hypothetical protein [Ktedonobacteraceae bacterium]